MKCELKLIFGDPGVRKRLQKFIIINAYFDFGKISWEIYFSDILGRKKKRLFKLKISLRKSRKILIFPNGLVHDFGQKFEKFPYFLTLREKWQNSNSDPRRFVHDFGLKLEIFS